MANCTILGFTAAPFATQTERGEANRLAASSHRNLLTCSEWIRKSLNRGRLEQQPCLITKNSSSSSLLSKQPGTHKKCWSRSFERSIALGRITFINVGRYRSLSAHQNVSHTSGSSRFSKAGHHHADLKGNSRRTNAKDFDFKGRKFVLAVLQSGSGTTSDGHGTQEIDSYTASSGQVLDSQNTQVANVSPRTRLANITIDGVSDENDLKRLQVQLKEIHGVVDVWLGPFMEGGIRGGFVTVHVHVEESVSSVSLIKEVQALDAELLILPYKSNTWLWRGHKINFGVAGCGKPIILVHGFGGNAGHFAKLIPYFTDHYRVYAIDLLGFGASDKPQDANYGPDLWAELIADFTREFAEEGAVLIGNSIGSLTSLAAAAMGGSDLFRGLVLLNCAGAMNRKGLAQDDPLIRVLSPIFIAIEYLLQRPRIANFLFNRFRRKENIRKILEEQAYRNKASVTDQLVDILYQPSTQPGATDVFVKVFTGDPGPRPETLMEKISVPLLLLWGDCDLWTPPNGSVAKYFMKLAAEGENVKVYTLPDVGHCPHDDRPELAADYILPFVASLDG